MCWGWLMTINWWFISLIYMALPGLAKLGYKDDQLVEELQLCALLQMGQFSAQDVAILLVALVSLTPRSARHNGCRNNQLVKGNPAGR
jgi:hypothetical protein